MPRKNETGRAANGSGSIRKRTVTKNGKSYTYWEARVTVGHDPITGRQVQRSITGKTQKEVAQKMREMAVEVDQGTYQAPSKMTLGEWLDIWLKDYLGSVKPRTLESYQCQIKNHIRPQLGPIKLDTLTTHTIQHFYNSLTDSGLSPKTVKIVHGVLHKALQQAVAISYLRFNPSDACILPRVERKELKPLDDDAIHQFMDAVKGHSHEFLFLVTLFTGMRQGEVLGLEWQDVDFEHGTVLIRRQLQKLKDKKGKYRYQFTSVKNSKWRKIAPAPFVMHWLKRQRAKQAEWRLLAGSAWEDTGLVFTNELGGHLMPHTIYHNFKRIVTDMGLPATRFHDLRHSYAVAAIKSGDDIKTVQGNLGHSTASFTLDVYGHVTDQMRQESAQRMEQYIKNVSGQ
ncbi:tyrosine-type recombinase/integrase [Intestinimonas sp. HCP28S3_D6]|uniref:tyrosine-type recombinase/integrase n=1 Tax=Intestinimonas sp. HCP28S3_D6 TaxID=3438942 RepID=UPI003F8A569B